MRNNKFLTLTMTTALLLLHTLFYTCVSSNIDKPVDYYFNQKLTIGKTPNGVTYYVSDKQPSYYDTVNIGLIVKAGSVQEQENQLGLAHFVEHMAFNGTTNFPGNTIISKLQEKGVRFGEDVNAATSYDYTYFYINVQNTPENLELALDILREWSTNITYDIEAIEKEKPVVLEEIRALQNKQTQLWMKNAKFWFGDNKYAKHFPGGAMDVIDNAPREVIKKFYDDWYKPNLMAVYVIGDIDSRKIIEQINARFDYQDTDAERLPIEISLGTPRTLQLAQMEDESQTNTVVMRYWLPRTPISNTQELMLYNIAQLSVNIINEQLQQLVNEGKLGTAECYTDRFVDYDQLVIAFEVLGEQFFESLQSVWELLSALEQNGIPQTVIDEQLTQWTESSQDTDYENITPDDVFYHFVHELPIINRGKSFFAAVKRAATQERVHAEIRKLLNQSELRMTMTASQKGLLPSEEETRALYNQIQQSVISTIDDASLQIDSLMNTDELAQIVKGKILKQSKHPKYKNGTIFNLSNGITVEYFKKSNKGFRIFSHAPGGKLALQKDFNRREKIIANNFDYITSDTSVIGRHSFLSLETFMNENELQAYNIIENSLHALNLWGPRDQTDSLFQLLYLYFTSRSYDTKQFDRVFTNFENHKIRLKNDPELYFAYRHAALLVPNNPFTIAPEEILQFTLTENDVQRAYQMHKQLTSNPQNYTFTITGDIPLGKLKKYITKYIASLPTSPDALTSETTLSHVRKYYATEEFNIVEKFSGTEQSLVQLSWVNTDLKPQLITIKDIIIIRYLEYLLDIILHDTIREEEAGVYYIFSRFFYEPILNNPYDVDTPRERTASLYINFGTEPSRAAELQLKAKKLIEDILASPPSADVIKQAEAGVMRWIDEEGYENFHTLTRLLYWNVYLAQNVVHVPDIKEKFSEMLKTIDSQDVIDFLRSIINDANFYSFVLEPKTLGAEQPSPR